MLLCVRRLDKWVLDEGHCVGTRGNCEYLVSCSGDIDMSHKIIIAD